MTKNGAENIVVFVRILVKFLSKITSFPRLKG